MPGNSLESVINRKGKQSSGHLHNAVSFGKKVDLLLGITRGMSYLHGLEPAIIHRDLKPGVSFLTTLTPVEYSFRQNTNSLQSCRFWDCVNGI
jgi:serine/threonine protein kinase